MIEQEQHPSLDVYAFVTRFPENLETFRTPDWWLELLNSDAEAPFESSDEIRKKVRNLLRYGGFKPTGRNKPASEYLLRAAGDGSLGSINGAVDACNVVSLHTGLPISVVDLQKVTMPLHIAIAPKGERYIFNASRQVIDISGLLCLYDSEGPCANGVKDSQRTKTDGSTTRTLSVVWGSADLPGLAEKAVGWYREILHKAGASTILIDTGVREVAA